ncbi:hypothetical protein Slin14017_G049350 [Septoria linicola]|nr:hypothetical protein Slin14017_G049350 [Septoria linicola]
MGPLTSGQVTGYLSRPLLKDHMKRVRSLLEAQTEIRENSGVPGRSYGQCLRTQFISAAFPADFNASAHLREADAAVKCVQAQYYRSILAVTPFHFPEKSHKKVDYYQLMLQPPIS